jgi:RNA polymerase sigma-70 factor (ECF subfamily)
MSGAQWETRGAEDREAARLVDRIQGGDEAAFADLYELYFDAVYGYMKVLFRNSHDAEDATQQVFVRLLKAIGSYERREQPFRAWLFTVVRNLALGELRKKHRLEVSDPARIDRHREDNGEAEQLPVLDWISDRDLLLFVERLPLAQRQVLLLRFMLGFSTREIGEILDRGANDVAVLQHRAIGFLRERLTAVGRAPEQRARERMTRWPQPARILRRRRFALHG